MSLPQGMLGASGLAGLIASLLLAGAPVAVAIVVFRRLQARWRAQYEELAADNRRNLAIVNASGEGVLELDNLGCVRYANAAALKMLGHEQQELLGVDYRTLINMQQDGRTDAVRKVRHTTSVIGGVGALLRRKNGQMRPIEYKVAPLIEDGISLGTALVFRDINERVRLDNLLKEMQVTAQIGAWEFDVRVKRVFWTEAVYAIFDLDRSEPIDAAFAISFFSGEHADRLSSATLAAVRAGASADLRLQATSARGRKRWVRVIIKAERRDGRTSRVHGTMQDVTDLTNAERQLRETRDFLDLTLDAAPMPIAYVAEGDGSRLVRYANKAMEEWLGRSRAQMIGKPALDVFAADSVAAVQRYTDKLTRGESVQVRLHGMRAGAAREWQSHFVPQLGRALEFIGFFVIVYDLTEQKRLEARLLQAQKMEAIGQLTGGIAHDFNNLLGVVIGNLQLLERNVADDPALARKVNTAMRAAARGADLTRRLLAFARRQILAPAVLDLNRQLTSLSEIMQRTLGESVEVRMVQAHDLRLTRVDAAQFENAILNLAINARDAMPNGGRLTVRTQNVQLDAAFCLEYPSIEPGEYVCVAVTDTGTGIEPDVLKRVFEPFFTTKESGKGSGLGLAMVHSFAEQAGGLALIESRVGEGTSVQLLLPRCFEEHATSEDTNVTTVVPGGTETILVAEDDADLRDTVVTALSELGYRAIAAANAAAALRVLAGAEPVHLLFTDVMMPGGVLGPALAKRARELRPQINVLFTTGYAEN
ncbi:MAG TPA: PAS domain-containing protein, partial [Steroidobacter sp.]|nr:PAS domain-containing protein [Steroidobacter sp.]